MKKIFISIILTILFFAPRVKALNSTLERMDNVYYSLQINNYYNSDNQGYMKIDGNLVYCFEPEKKYYGNQNYNQVDYVSLTQEQVYKANLIGHYGYEYYGHQNYLYYLAAQELIWRVTRPSIEMSWSTEIHGRNYSIFPVEKEKKEIQYLVDNHFTKPYFDGDEIDISYNEIITLKDDILRYYEVDSNNESDIRIEDNKLIIHKNNLNEEIIKLKKKVKYDDKTMTLYSSTNYQSVILSRTNDEVISTVKLKQIKGKVSISIVDSITGSTYGRNGGLLKGTEYNLYDEFDNPIETIVFNGEIYRKDLLSGKYKLKQIKAGTGYLLDDNIYEFEINENNLEQNIILKNNLLKAPILFEKLYGDERLKEENAVFEINDSIKSQTITTNSEGIALFDLEYGIYDVKQIKGIENHHFASAFRINVQSTLELQFKIINEEVKTNLKINNIDFITREIIKERVNYKIFNIDKKAYILNGNSDIFTTNYGIIDVSELSYGNYYIEQVSTPKDYISNEKIYFSVPKDFEITIENKKNCQNIKVIVKGEDELLDDVELEIYSKEDVVVNGNLIYKKDALIDNVITHNGQALSIFLPISTYYIKEVKINDDYILDESVYEVNLFNESNLEIQNYRKKEEVVSDIIIKDENELPKEENIPIKKEINKEESIIKPIENEQVIDNILKQDFKNKTDENIISNYLNEQYIKIPNTGVEVKETKLSIMGALIIVLMGYIVLRYAKE